MRSGRRQVPAGAGRRPRRRWHATTPLTRALLALALFQALLPAAVERSTCERSAPDVRPLHFSRLFLRHVQGIDSWFPMWLAYARLRALPGAPLYRSVFFQDHVKFQYPVTSLLVPVAIDRLAGDARGDPTDGLAPEERSALNGVSWALTLVTMVLVVLILRRQLVAHAPEHLEVGPGDGLARVVAVVLLCITYCPLVQAYGLGQIQAWVDALVAGLVYCWGRGWTAGAGVLAGLVCLVKPYFGLLLAWSALRRHWRLGAALVVTVVVGALAARWMLGTLDLAGYGRVLANIARHGEAFYDNQSVNGLLHRLLLNGYNLHWRSHFYAPYDPWVARGTALAGALLLGTAIGSGRGRRARDGDLDLAIMLLSLTLAPAVVWTHHYGILLPLYAVLVPRCLGRAPRGRWLRGAVVASFVLTGSGVACLTNRVSHIPVLNVVQSTVLAGGVLLLVVLHALARRGRC